MVKKKNSDSPSKKSKGKIAKLKLTKETVKDLTNADAAKVKGGRLAVGTVNCTVTCATYCNCARQ